MEKMKFHEYANLFPLLNETDLTALVEDIKANGLNEPITLHKDGSILDGRNRYRACLLAEVEPVTIAYTGDDPLSFVLSQNLYRMHMDESQRSMVGQAIKPMFAEQAKERMLAGKKTDPGLNSTQGSESRSAEQAAKAVNVGTSSIKCADKVVKQGIPELAQAVRNAVIPVSAAAAIVDYSEKQQKKMIEAVKSGESKNITHAKRQINKENLKAVKPLKGIHRVLYADPPWNYGNSGLDDYGHAERHYPCMSIKELCEMKVKEISDKNSVLFLWTTSPLLEEAFKVINAWGFKYKTSFIWDKVKHNFGYYNSVRHELLLICTRGSCLPEIKTLYDSVIEIERTKEHSEKPERLREIIDTLYPSGNRIELFARKPVDGWETWGNQCDG